MSIKKEKVLQKSAAEKLTDDALGQVTGGIIEIVENASPFSGQCPGLLDPNNNSLSQGDHHA